MKEYTTKTLEGKLILLSTILASGMAFLDGSVVNIAIPTIQSTFHATLIDIQWVVNGYMLMLCSLILVSGALGDRFGRKKIFVYGIVLFTFASFLCSIADSIVQLSVFRAIQGVGGAMMVPGSLSIISTSFHQDVRGKAIGLWSGFAGGVAALGPFAGGWLVQTLGWPSIFYINIPLGIIAFFLTLRYVPESRNNLSVKIDIWGAIFLFLSLLGVSYSLISEPDLGITNPVILSSFIIGVISFILFIWIEKKVKEPIVPFKIFKSKIVTGANLATFFLYFSLSGLVFFLVLNFQQIQHYSPIVAGIAMLPTILLITFLSGKGGGIADRIGPRIPMIVGPIMVAAGMFSFVFAERHAQYLTQFLPGLVLFGLGMAVVIASLTKSALAVQEEYSGAASGINNAVARIAGLFAIAILGVMMLSLFNGQLYQELHTSSLTHQEQSQILSQSNKLGGIEIPPTFNSTSKNAARDAVENAFVHSFQWTIGINALLALLSAVISFFMIGDTKNKKSKTATT